MPNSVAAARAAASASRMRAPCLSTSGPSNRLAPLLAASRAVGSQPISPRWTPRSIDIGTTKRPKVKPARPLPSVVMSVTARTTYQP